MKKLMKILLCVAAGCVGMGCAALILGIVLGKSTGCAGWRKHLDRACGLLEKYILEHPRRGGWFQKGI